MSKTIHPEQACIWLADRSYRSISNKVFSTCIALPEMNSSESDKWSDAMGDVGCITPGDVVILPPEDLVTTTMSEALHTWLAPFGVGQPATQARFNALACLGAFFHHDIQNYTNEVFAIMWLSDEPDYDLYFPALNVRIPLELGTAVMFDSGQPHGVVRRGHSVFDDAEVTGSGLFVSKDLIANEAVQQLMGIEHYNEVPTRYRVIGERGVFTDEVHNYTGAWSQR